MYTKRIIPCLDVKNGRVVKGTNFVTAMIWSAVTSWYFWILQPPMNSVIP